VDIKMILGGQEIGTMQAMSYAIQREKAPLYVLGRVDPLAFSRGKRGIAGTAVALLIEEHMLFRALEDARWFIADGDELRPVDGAASQDASAAADNLERADGGPNDAPYEAGNLSNNYLPAQAWNMDQILPQDCVLVAQNEVGISAQMRIFGMEFLNEGSGVSIDDRTIECQHTWIARTVLPWRKTGQFGTNDAITLRGAGWTPSN
jgi:hypothetical protein